MNLLSCIVLIVIAVAFVASVRFAFFNHTGRHASGCNGCGSRNVCQLSKGRSAKCTPKAQRS